MTNFSAGALLGAQAPRVAHAPKAPWSHAEDAAFLASSYGLTPDPWQMLVLEAWLGERKDGKWAASRCGLAVPRQNGKNGIIEVRELYGMVALGERFLHSAHEVKTARKAFVRLASFFENERKFPELAAMVKEIRKTNGQEAIVLTNGGSVEFVARSKGSARGFTVDVLVMDEAQELSDESLEAMLPTISAAPQQNPQTILTGTPPAPGMNGEVFTRVRDSGVRGEGSRQSWHEWSIPGPVDVKDRQFWYAVNPALGRRLNVEVIEDELAQMSPDGFMRERLGMWSLTSGEEIIDSEAWKRARVAPEDALSSGRVAFALDMTPDRKVVTISACRWQGDDPRHIEVVRHEPTSAGVSWVVEWLAERWPHTSAVVVDGQSPAVTLLPELISRRVRVTVTNYADMVKACGLFVDGLRDGEITHIYQPALDAAVAGARKRNIGQGGGWGWDRRSPDVDLSPLVSATLAYYGSLIAKRNPDSRKAKVMVL